MTVATFRYCRSCKRWGARAVGAVRELCSFGVYRGVRLAYGAFADLRKEAPSADIP